MTTIAIDADRFRNLLSAVNAQGHGPGGWTRLAWTPELRAAEQAVADVAATGGLVAEHDPAGNLWLTDPAAPEGGLIATGSHLDTVPDGGAFDGALGVVAGLEAVLALRAAGAPGAERLAVIAFADEEGGRFNTPVFGSRMMVGSYGAEMLDRIDADGVTLREVGPADPEAAAGLEQRLDAYYEIHVEQGLALDPADVSLGIATGLAARGRWTWSIDGEANHAGTTPMAGRRDALVAAAGLVLAVKEAAEAVPGAVATVGVIGVEPGGTNVVPGRAFGTIDARAMTNAERDAVVAAVSAACPEATIEMTTLDDGAVFDEALRADLFAVAEQYGVTAMDLPSYAGHDAGTMALAGVPSAMVFTRSPNGLSHNPAEHSDEAVCLDAIRILADAMGRRLAR